MAYIVNRNDHFYVVAYDGVDPNTGKERRRWHPAGRSRADAEAVAASITETAGAPVALGRDAVTLGEHFRASWLPKRSRRVRPTTAYRYSWMIEHYIDPTLGNFALRSIRTEHIDRLYADLLSRGGRSGHGLAPKTVHEVHVIIRSTRSTVLSTLDCSAPTQRRKRDHRDHSPGPEPARPRGAPGLSDRLCKRS